MRAPASAGRRLCRILPSTSRRTCVSTRTRRQGSSAVRSAAGERTRRRGCRRACSPLRRAAFAIPARRTPFPFKQVWGGAVEGPRRLQDEGLPEVGAEHESHEFDLAQAEAEAWERRRNILTWPQPPSSPQPFAFISDHAFWELGPDSVAGDSGACARDLDWDDGRPFDAEQELRSDVADQMERIAAMPPAAAAPGGAQLPDGFELRLAVILQPEPTVLARWLDGASS